MIDMTDDRDVVMPHASAFDESRKQYQLDIWLLTRCHQTYHIGCS